jgi:hypothetical protein
VLVLVVDVANVMGSRPDGWWRDRAGAATRLLDSLVPLAELGRIVAVLEGQARTATVPAQIEATLAPADGDSTIVAVAQAVLAEGDQPLVVTADRGLRARLPVGTRIAGPRWLLDQCSNAL